MYKEKNNTLFKQSLFDLVASKFGQLRKKEAMTLILAAKSCAINENEVMNFLSQSALPNDYDKALVFFFNVKVKQIASLTDSIVGIWWHYINIESQLQPISAALSDRKDFKVINVVDKKYAELAALTNDCVFCEQEYLITPAFLYKKMTFLKAIFIQEDYYDEIPFPLDAVRIGLPHGADVAIDTTINRYSGWIFFDYIFCGKKEKLSFEVVGSPCPKKILQKKSTDCILIPGGIPKLDKFIEIVNFSKPTKKIICQMARLDVESNFIKKNIYSILSKLCKEFKDYTILFRSDPIDHDKKLISELMVKIQKLSNLEVSTTLSYIEDYSDAIFMVSTRDASGKNFVTATGRPIIFFSSRSNKKIEDVKDFGFKVFSFYQLIEKAKNLVTDSAEVPEYRGDQVFNRGCSGDYLRRNLDKMINREVARDWERIKLPLAKEKLKSSEVLEFLDRQINMDKPSFSIGMAVYFNYKLNPSLRLKGIEAVIRSQASVDREIRLIRIYDAFKLFASFVENSNKDKREEIYRIYFSVVFPNLVKIFLKGKIDFFTNFNVTIILIKLFFFKIVLRSS